MYYYIHENEIFAVSSKLETLKCELCLRLPKIIADPTLYPNVELKEGYEILETDKDLYALTSGIMFEEDLRFEEALQKDIDKARTELFLTPADLQRFIYKDTNLTFTEIKELAAQAGIDSKLLEIEMTANNFYRAHSLIIQIGELIGYTEKELDYMFYNHKCISENKEEVEKFQLIKPYEETEL